MPLETNDQGYLYVTIPRVQYLIASVLLAVTAVLFALWIAKDPGGSGGGVMPGWFRIFALVFCVAFAIGLFWLSVYARPLEFDEGRKSLVRGARVIAAFAEMDHVEIREKRTRNYVFYRVVLCLNRSRRIDLGPQRSQIDASTMAADIATVIDKPVRVVVR